MKNFTVLTVGPWYPANSYRYLIDSFEKVGCEVFRIGPTYNNHYGVRWSKEDKVIPDLELPRQADWDLNYFVEQCAAKLKVPDLLIVSEETYHNEITPTNKVPSVLISYDGWPENYERAEIYKCTLNYTNHPFGIRIHPREEEDPRFRYLPGACAPWVHKNLNLERDWDFVLLATMYGKRPAICNDLAKWGIRAWYGHAPTSVYVEAHNRALTTLHTCNGQEEIKWRWWEAQAMGCLVISDNTKLFARLGYKPWVHYVPIPVHEDPEFGGEPWPEIDELYETIRFLKNQPGGILSNIASTGRIHTLKTGTYFHRIKTIFTDLGMSQMVSAADREIEGILLENDII